MGRRGGMLAIMITKVASIVLQTIEMLALYCTSSVSLGGDCAVTTFKIEATKVNKDSYSTDAS